ncbi:uncharacterized protein [Argopecten irradians]|uniref:uncharacterized protein n=1 Tax=Argopecten irradians TaxID=31199 RepID=UPI00371C3C61
MKRIDDIDHASRASSSPRADDRSWSNMASEDVFQDSQDLFVANDQHTQETQPPASLIEHADPLPENAMLATILKELRELKEMVARSTHDNCHFVFEKSPIEKPLTEYLKQRFVSYPFMKRNDQELLRKIHSLTKELNIKRGSLTQETVKAACITASLRKMTEWRNQTKGKICNKEGKDPGEESLLGLASLLFRKFGGKEEDAVRLTACIRSYCHEEKLLRKLAGTQQQSTDFWTGVQNRMEAIERSTDPQKWTKVTDRERNRIERYKAM